MRTAILFVSQANFWIELFQFVFPELRDYCETSKDCREYAYFCNRNVCDCVDGFRPDDRNKSCIGGEKTYQLDTTDFCIWCSKHKEFFLFYCTRGARKSIFDSIHFSFPCDLVIRSSLYGGYRKGAAQIGPRKLIFELRLSRKTHPYSFSTKAHSVRELF